MVVVSIPLYCHDRSYCYCCYGSCYCCCSRCCCSCLSRIWVFFGSLVCRCFSLISRWICCWCSGCPISTNYTPDRFHLDTRHGIRPYTHLYTLLYILPIYCYYSLSHHSLLHLYKMVSLQNPSHKVCLSIDDSRAFLDLFTRRVTGGLGLSSFHPKTDPLLTSLSPLIRSCYPSHELLFLPPPSPVSYPSYRRLKHQCPNCFNRFYSVCQVEVTLPPLTFLK